MNELEKVVYGKLRDNFQLEIIGLQEKVAKEIVHAIMEKVREKVIPHIDYKIGCPTCINRIKFNLKELESPAKGEEGK